MNTIKMHKTDFDHLMRENTQLKKENKLLRNGKLAKLYKSLDDHYKEITEGKVFTRSDLKI